MMNSADAGVMYWIECIAKIAITIPNDSDPLSPINIFAGFQLKNKNARSVTVKNEDNEISNSSPFSIPIAKKVTNITMDIDAASPSSPSIRFKAFVYPAMAKKVKGKTNQAGKTISYPKYVPKEYMAKSFIYNKRDAKKIKINFILGEISFRSSNVPTINTMAIAA